SRSAPTWLLRPAAFSAVTTTIHWPKRHRNSEPKPRRNDVVPIQDTTLSTPIRCLRTHNQREETSWVESSSLNSSQSMESLKRQEVKNSATQIGVSPSTVAKQVNSTNSTKHSKHRRCLLAAKP